MDQLFVQAVAAAGSPECTPSARMHAEAWLLQFAQHDECWEVALQLAGAPDQPAEVTAFAAQTLKAMARARRAAPADACQRLQQDLAHLLRQRPDLPVQSLRQVALALAHTSLPLAHDLPALLHRWNHSLPATTAITVLQMLAEEAQALEPFGQGSSDERTARADAIKADVRGHASSVYAWLAAASRGAAAAVAPLACPGGAAASSHVATAGLLLSCFQAWVAVAGLQGIAPADMHALVGTALTHLQDPRAPAFLKAADALCLVLDHCPNEWLPGLHAPLIDCAVRAVLAAEAGDAPAAETLCKMFAAYAGLCIDAAAPHSSPQSAAACAALEALAALPQVANGSDEDGADPVSGPALAAWVLLTEQVADGPVGGYDVLDDVELLGAQPGAQASDGGRWPNSVASPTGSTEGVAADVAALYERIFVALLRNVVAWQQPAAAQEAAMDRFSPAFRAGLADCMACCCAVMGPIRYMRVLEMLVDRPRIDPLAPYTTAAALMAATAAGRVRLTSDPATAQSLARLLQHAASLTVGPCGSTRFLVPFLCASAAFTRTCLETLAASISQQAAADHLIASFNKARQGLALPSDGPSSGGAEAAIPAAVTLRELVVGAHVQGLHLPVNLPQALLQALLQPRPREEIVERALVVAATSAMSLVEHTHPQGLHLRRAAIEAIAAPAVSHAMTLSVMLQAGNATGRHVTNVDSALAAALRRFYLVLQQHVPDDMADGQACPAHSTNGAAGMLDELAELWWQRLWPPLAACMQHGERGAGGWLASCCKCLALLGRAHAPDVANQAPVLVQLLAPLLFHISGCAAAEPLAALLPLLPTTHQGAGVAHSMMAGLLAAPRALQLSKPGGADQDPELAEALLRVVGTYVCNVLEADTEAPLGAQAAALALSASVPSLCRLAAACCCANHKGVAQAAQAAMLALIGSARDGGGLMPHDHMPRRQLQAAVASQGAVLTTGLLGSLLAASPLARIPRVQGLLQDLAGLACRAPSDGNNPEQLLSTWLVQAAGQLNLPPQDQDSIARQWSAAALEAEAASTRGDARDRAATVKRLRTRLRDFAERYSRAQ